MKYETEALLCLGRTSCNNQFHKVDSGFDSHLKLAVIIMNGFTSRDSKYANFIFVSLLYKIYSFLSVVLSMDKAVLADVSFLLMELVRYGQKFWT